MEMTMNMDNTTPNGDTMRALRNDTYKTARRVYHRLLDKHRDELRERDEFECADRSICPDLWDAAQEEPTYRNAAGDIEESLLLTVAFLYGLEPRKLDDMMSAADWEELGCVLRDSDRRHVHARGIFVPGLVRIECRNSSCFD